jgi:CSLREA domain-containing protein
MASARALAAVAAIGVIGIPGAALAAKAPASPVTVRVTAPATASTESGFGVSLSVEGAGVAGLQAKVLFDGKAVEIGGTAPTSKTARSLGPVAVSGGDLVGYYNGRPTGAKAEQVAQVVLFPSRAGRLQIRVGSIEVVDRLGRRLAVRVVGGTSIVRVGTSTKLFGAATPGAARAAGSGRFDADLYRDGQVTKADLDEALYDWGSTTKSGDANGDGVVDVSDVQGVSARTTRHPRLQVGSGPLTFVVNTTADAQDAAPGNGICLTAAGECSLRAAIDESNRHSGRSTRPASPSTATPSPAPTPTPTPGSRTRCPGSGSTATAPVRRSRSTSRRRRRRSRACP